MKPWHLLTLIALILTLIGAHFAMTRKAKIPGHTWSLPAEIESLQTVYGGASNQVGNRTPTAVFAHPLPKLFSLENFAKLICEQALGEPAADWKQILGSLAGKPMPGYEKEKAWPSTNFNWEMVEVYDSAKSPGSTLRADLNKIHPLDLYLDMLINNLEGHDPASLTRLLDAAFEKSDYLQLKVYRISDGGVVGGMIIAGCRKDQSGVAMIYYWD